MSETNETSGRCRREIDSIDGCAVRHIPGGVRPRHVLADAIDRLAADVAAVKEGVCGNRITVEETKKIQSDMEWVNKHEQWRREERDAARMERDAAIRERDEALAEIERLKNELYDREQELLSLRADTVERYTPSAAPQPAAPPAGWLTEEERRVLRDLLDVKWADVFERVPAALLSILARAGSPPVVEVPVISERDVPKRNEALAYRAALDKAGVKWKEVGRE